MLASASVASAAVIQTHDSVRHEVFTGHDTNICGDLATFTFDVTSHTHIVVRSDGTFTYNFSQVFTYILVFDDPALGAWSARGAETIIHISTGSSDEKIHDNLSSREGPVQIIVHQQLRFDPDGNVTVDREFELVSGC